MAEAEEIERIAREVVDANTAPDTVVSVSSMPSLDWTGDPILKVSIEIRTDKQSLLSGRAPLNILTQLSDRLVDAGEDRFPIIDYATTEEREAAGDNSEP